MESNNFYENCQTSGIAQHVIKQQLNPKDTEETG
jgi:hypothetical protein